MPEAVSTGATWRGPAGTAIPLYFGTHNTIRSLWYVHLPSYHPVLEWFCAALYVEGWGHVFSVAPIDPETYVEQGFDPTKMESCCVIDSDTIAFQFKDMSAASIENVADGLVTAMINAVVVPDKWAQGPWIKEIERLKKLQEAPDDARHT